MAISSIGVGSGLDAEKIITQLTDLEKKPLTQLQAKATTLQTQLSTVGTINSQISALSDAAFKLTLDSAWSGVTVGSTDASKVSGTVTGVAAATSFGVEVSQLAKAQSVASTAVTTGSAIGTGTMTLETGTWDYGTVPPGFTAGSASSVNLTIVAGEDTITAIAAKINNANAGMTATVLRDASGERLLLRSNSTGEATGLRIKVTGDSDLNDTNSSGLSRLAFDLADAVAPVPPSTVPKASYGMAANEYQQGQNATAKVNGITVTSATNSVTDAIPGLTLSLSAITTTPIQITLSTDQTTVKKNISDFVAAYNTLQKSLADATKYDDQTKTAGILQGDTTMVNLKNAFRRLMGSSSTGSTVFTHLSNIGLTIPLDGQMVIDGSKLDAALKDMTNLKKLFAANNSNAQTNGIALKVKDFARGMLAVDGAVTNKTTALQAATKRNTQEQEKVNVMATLVEKRLRKQYTALDARMSSLTALNNYVTQQVAQWNKNTA